MAEKKEEAQEKIELFEPQTRAKFKKIKGIISEHLKEFAKPFKNPWLLLAFVFFPLLAVISSIQASFLLGISLSLILIIDHLMMYLLDGRSNINYHLSNFFYIMINLFLSAMIILVIDKNLPIKINNISIYLPLASISFIVFRKQESSSPKKNIIKYLLEALGLSFSLLFALILISSVSEILGTGNLTFLGSTWGILRFLSMPLSILMLSAGAFFILAYFMSFANLLMIRKNNKIRLRQKKQAIKSIEPPKGEAKNG